MALSMLQGVPGQVEEFRARDDHYIEKQSALTQRRKRTLN